MKKRFISVILSAMMIMTACAPKEETTSTVASKQSEKNEDIQATEAAEETSSLLWSSIFVTLVAKKYHESVTLPSGLRMVYDNH